LLIPPKDQKEANFILNQKDISAISNLLKQLKKNTSEIRTSIYEDLFITFIEPMINVENGIIHKDELFLYLYEKNCIKDDTLFNSTISFLSILEGDENLFHTQLHATNNFFTRDKITKEWLDKILLQTEELISETEESISLKNLAFTLSRLQLFTWNTCNSKLIEKILFWNFSNNSRKNITLL